MPTRPDDLRQTARRPGLCGHPSFKFASVPLARRNEQSGEAAAVLAPSEYDLDFSGREGLGMKTLFLLRHAKSSWDDSTLPDHDRPLEARGERDAAKMSKRWSQQHEKPDLIISSPAARAIATAKVIAQGLNYKPKNIAVNDRLYAATKGTLIAVIEALDDKLDRVMLVGHNPGFAELAHHFDSGISRMPTCAIAEFRFDAKSWSTIGQTRPALTIFDSPKQSLA